MTNEKSRFEAAQKAFNTINVFKGQSVSMATCDEQGNPNVAPIGSMRVVDENTVYILQGFLPKTVSNLRNNPKVAFSMCTKSSIIKDLMLFVGKKEKVMGYRIYGEFVGEEESAEVIAEEGAIIARRVPFFLRGVFLSFLRKHISRRLKFRITSVRAVV